MVNSNRELVLVRNLRWLNKEKYSFSVHFIPFFPSTLFLFSKTRIHSASGGQEMLIRSEAFNQGDIYENEGTLGTRLFQCYFGLRAGSLYEISLTSGEDSRKHVHAIRRFSVY